MGTLYLVATPIGNLEDISARALRILKQVSLIAAEDTRRTAKLLAHYHIQTPLTSFFEHNQYTKMDVILSALARGDVALVSDAGTPALNDPGYELVKAALAAGHAVSPIPGPCAPIAALIASGLPSDAFVYLGYLPRKSGERRRFLKKVAELPYTLVILETPHRLLAALEEMFAIFGDRPVSIGRELTKVHEEFYRGTLSGALDYFRHHPPRGEFTLVIAGCPPICNIWSEEQLRELIYERLEAGDSPASIAAQAAELSGWSRRDVYRLITAARKNLPGNNQLFRSNS